MTILPQLGSSPATAVLNKGEFAIEKAIFLALAKDFALITFIVINLFAPSPSTTICLAKFKQSFLELLQIFELLYHSTINFVLSLKI